MLFPESKAAIRAQAEEVPVTDPAFSIEEQRAAARTAALSAPREHVGSVQDLEANGVPCRLYVPDDPEPGLVVHLHGGGFVFNDVEVHDPSCRRMANRGRRAVLSVEYRRPPEHPFPAAPDDVDQVLAWLDGEAQGLGVTGPQFVHGDSAGANLALVAALRHPDRFAALALIYPFLDPSAGFESYHSAAAGFAPEEAAWYWQQYAATEADLSDPDLAPLLSDRLGTLPPTLIVTCEHDPLRDEGEHLAGLLAEAGVEVVCTRYLGQVHGIWRHPETFPSAEPMLRQVVGFLAAHAG